MKKYEMWVNGQWVGARSGATRELRDPGDSSAVASVPESGREDVTLAIDAAREAFDRGPWRKQTAQDRGQVLFKVAQAIRAAAKPLAELEVRSCGKPLAEAEFDV